MATHTEERVLQLGRQVPDGLFRRQLDVRVIAENAVDLCRNKQTNDQISSYVNVQYRGRTGKTDCDVADVWQTPQ